MATVLGTLVYTSVGTNVTTVALTAWDFDNIQIVGGITPSSCNRSDLLSPGLSVTIDDNTKQIGVHPTGSCSSEPFDYVNTNLTTTTTTPAPGGTTTTTTTMGPS